MVRVEANDQGPLVSSLGSIVEVWEDYGEAQDAIRDQQELKDISLGSEGGDTHERNAR